MKSRLPEPVSLAPLVTDGRARPADRERIEQGNRDHYDLLLRIAGGVEDDFRWLPLREMLLTMVTGKRVLDIGCGTGHLTLALLRRGFDAYGVDRDPRTAAYAGKVLAAGGFPAARITVADARTDGLAHGEYDCLLLVDVLEHIEDDIDFLRRCLVALRPGGQVLVVVPALPLLYSDKDVFEGHYRRYARSGLLAVCAEAGLAVGPVRYWNFCGCLVYFVLNNLLRINIYRRLRTGRSRGERLCQAGFRRLLLLENRLCWLPFGMNLVVSAVKPPAAAAGNAAPS